MKEQPLRAARGLLCLTTRSREVAGQREMAMLIFDHDLAEWCEQSDWSSRQPVPTMLLSRVIARAKDRHIRASIHSKGSGGL